MAKSMCINPKKISELYNICTKKKLLLGGTDFPVVVVSASDVFEDCPTQKAVAIYKEGPGTDVPPFPYEEITKIKIGEDIYILATT